MIRKDMPEIVRGHEVWLEHDKRHAHVGETFECKLSLGHNMAVDGMADIENVKAGVFDPAIDGYHTVAVEYYAGIYTVTDDGWHIGPKSDYENVKRSWYYYQYARSIVSVGYGGPKVLRTRPLPDSLKYGHFGDRRYFIVKGIKHTG